MSVPPVPDTPKIKFSGCLPEQYFRIKQGKVPLSFIIRKSYDKIKKVLYDFWDAGSAAQLIISRMISSLVCRISSSAGTIVSW
jgi:hypothetical protein